MVNGKTTSRPKGPQDTNLKGCVSFLRLFFSTNIFFHTMAVKHHDFWNHPLQLYYSISSQLFNNWCTDRRSEKFVLEKWRLASLGLDALGKGELLTFFVPWGLEGIMMILVLFVWNNTENLNTLYIDKYKEYIHMYVLPKKIDLPDA